jgi:hypothetical protein
VLHHLLLGLILAFVVFHFTALRLVGLG